MLLKQKRAKKIKFQKSSLSLFAVGKFLAGINFLLGYVRKDVCDRRFINQKHQTMQKAAAVQQKIKGKPSSSSKIKRKPRRLGCRYRKAKGVYSISRSARVALLLKNEFEDPEELRFAQQVVAKRLETSDLTLIITTSASHKISTTLSLAQIKSCGFLMEKYKEALYQLPEGNIINPVRFTLDGSYRVVIATFSLISAFPCGFAVTRVQFDYLKEFMQSRTPAEREQLTDTLFAICCNQLVACIERVCESF